MKKIFKYELPIIGGVIKVHKNSQIISIANQFGIPCLWLLCDPAAEFVDMQIDVFGTGQEFDHSVDRHLLGTLLFNDGALIFHFFARK